jgi:hypothetical protein
MPNLVNLNLFQGQRHLYEDTLLDSTSVCRRYRNETPLVKIAYGKG